MVGQFNRFATATIAADGTATIAPGALVATQYAAMLASFQASGNPTWRLLISGRPVGSGAGPNVDIGPRIVAPSEQVSLVVAGGLPNTTVSGQFHGGRADTVEEAIQFASLLGANTQSLLISNTRIPLYPDGYTGQKGSAFPSFVLQASANPTFTFTLPPNVTNIRVANAPGSAAWSIGIFGHQTTRDYLEQTNVGSGLPLDGLLPIDVRVDPEWDSQVDIVLQELDGTGPTPFYVSGLTGAETTVVAGTLANIQVVPGGFPNEYPPFARPQQNPLEVENNTGASPFGVIAATPGRTLYIFSWDLQIDGAAANRVAFLQPTSGSRFGQVVGANVGRGGQLNGVALVTGAGVNVVHTAIAGETVRTILTYS